LSVVPAILFLVPHVRPQTVPTTSTPRRVPGAVVSTVSWKHGPCLFPQHGPGRKHDRPIVLEEWQTDVVRACPPTPSGGPSTPTPAGYPPGRRARWPASGRGPTTRGGSSSTRPRTSSGCARGRWTSPRSSGGGPRHAWPRCRAGRPSRGWTGCRPEDLISGGDGRPGQRR
jgi:hypothetical protein